MLKPNYSMKRIERNYTIYSYTGKGYFDMKYTKGIHRIYVNGFEIMLIPFYDIQKNNFPPTVDDFKKIGDNPKNYDQSRIFLFNSADLVLFECPNQQEKNYKFFPDEDLHEVTKQFGLIHCISNLEYKLVKKYLSEMVNYFNLKEYEGILSHHLKRDDISQLKIIDYLDNKFTTLKDELPVDFKKSLQLY